MSYKALYLTYRPQTFEEVAGQKPIVRTLKNVLTTGKMAHAYLFAGPRPWPSVQPLPELSGSR